MANWQTKEELTELLTNLVEHASVTGSSEEIAISEYLQIRLRELSYFQENPDHLQLHPTSDGRKFLTALVKRGLAKKTVVMLSHFDVVDVEDYGDWKNLAFRPLDLTNEINRNIEVMPDEVREDIESGDWLFGRGTMDMKAGASLQMSMLEKASEGEFDGNLLMLSVPDEEANSTGMIEAVEVLLDWAKKYELDYQAVLNSEPVFTRYPGDRNLYVYSGSVGKVLPGFFCYGRETHVGEPFAGLNANNMVAQLTQALELNTDFCEIVAGEVTPPPTNLMQKDLKEEYSTQIPHTAVTNFNILTMERPLDQLNDHLLKVAKDTAAQMEKDYYQKAKQYAEWQPFDPVDFQINIYTYDELLDMAEDAYGKDEIERRQAYISANYKELGDRDLSSRLVSDLAALCKDKAPMIVLFYNPPFYPAVSSRDNEHIQKVIEKVTRYSEEHYQISLKHQRFFAGLSDLSFTGLQLSLDDLNPLMTNMPLYGNGYDLPFDALRELNLPVMNLGPLGRDPHRWTERLELDYSFGTLHDTLSYTIGELLK
ncbi:MAG TPA: M20/M25/M40 family metallo-hydrolase [Bacillales bacterium]|nr:M20/M25/M40 family metallo-hydrolase [Bacillales bacterium]